MIHQPLGGAQGQAAGALPSSLLTLLQCLAAKISTMTCAMKRGNQIYGILLLRWLLVCCADIEIQANEILHHKLTLNGYLAEFTGQSMERITQVHCATQLPYPNCPTYRQEQ